MIQLYRWYSKAIVIGSVLLLFGVFWEIANEPEADYAQEILGLAVALAGIGSFWQGSIDTLKRLFKGINIRIGTQEPELADISMRTRRRLVKCIINGELELINFSATNKAEKRNLENATRLIRQRIEYLYKIYPYTFLPNTEGNRQLQADHLVEIFLRTVWSVYKPVLESKELTVEINFPVAQRITRKDPKHSFRSFKFEAPVSAVADDFFGMVPYGASIPLEKAPVSFIVNIIIPALLVRIDIAERQAESSSIPRTPLTSWCRLGHWNFSLRRTTCA